MRPIHVTKNGNSCWIRWIYGGDRYSLTWGKWNDPIEKARLDFCAKMIYRDCLIDEFDSTLNKYKCWLQGIESTSNGNGKNKVTKKFPPLVDLLADRIEELYNSADYSLLKLLRKYGKDIKTVEAAKEFMKWLAARELKDSTKKRYLAILTVLRRDLFQDIEVKISQKPKPKPFTKEEVTKILIFLKNNQYYSSYHDLILFLFNTGCRPSEAIGLLWRDVDIEKRALHIYESLGRSKGSSSKRERKPTKTRKYRIIPMNNNVYTMLMGRSRGEDEDLVFYSPKGKCIDDHNLSQRIFKTTLEKLGIPHRPLYTTRSTFVSHCIDSGMTVQEVSSITGHSIQVLIDSYLGSVKKPKLPEL